MAFLIPQCKARFINLLYNNSILKNPNLAKHYNFLRCKIFYFKEESNAFLIIIFENVKKEGKKKRI